MPTNKGPHVWRRLKHPITVVDYDTTKGEARSQKDYRPFNKVTRSYTEKEIVEKWEKKYGAQAKM